MASSAICPTEDTIQALIEYLVDPLLPPKPNILDKPAPSLQQSIAEQVHSVVLLYTYYHRKQHPDLAILTFGDFCKLAVVLRPSLLAHLTLMQNPSLAYCNDAEKHLSLTERKIMEALDICACLNKLENVPKVEGWPVSKVAVLLLDNKDNCVLLFSSITKGVWSVVEEDVETSKQNRGVTSGKMYTCKKKDELKFDDAGMLKVGYSAVKEAAGVNETDIMVLGNYTVYSHRKEKAASRFYIMKCSQSINQEVKRVPIKDLIKSLQGPLVRKSYGSWRVTPVVEYYHVLPYIELISEWFSRQTFSSSLQDSKLVDTAQDLYMNNSSVFRCEDREELQHNGNTLQASEGQEIQNQSVQPVKADKVDSRRIQSTCNETTCVSSSSQKEAIEERAFVANGSNSDTEKLQNLLALKGMALSQTALAALQRKRNELVLQQRMIEDEIALCDKKIQRMSTGGEGDLELKIEAIIEGCNDILVINQGKTCQHLKDQCLVPCVKRKRLTEAVLNVESACQELDGICRESNWILPTYRLSYLEGGVPNEGGFQANVTVKGPDFECSCGGEVWSQPCEARESAAAQMLLKLRRMQKSSN